MSSARSTRAFRSALPFVTAASPRTVSTRTDAASGRTPSVFGAKYSRRRVHSDFSFLAPSLRLAKSLDLRLDETSTVTSVLSAPNTGARTFA